MKKFIIPILFIATNGFSREPIKIGAILPLTGPISAYGRECLFGIKIGLDEVNEEYKKFDLIVKDDLGTERGAEVALEKLAKEGVFIVIGPLISKNVISIIDDIQKFNILIITPSATTPLITKLSDLVFRICYTDEYQGEVMASFAFFTLKKKKVGIFEDATQIYSKTLADGFEKFFEKIGGKIVGREHYLPTDTDFRHKIWKLIEKGAESIFIPGYYAEVKTIINQARAVGIKIPFLGGDGWDFPQLIEIGENSGINYYCTHFFPMDPDVKVFRDKYIARFGIEPSSFSALGYDAIKLLGTLDIIPEIASPNIVKKAIMEVKDFQGVTGKIDFTQGRDPLKSVVILKFEKGEISLEKKIIPKKK